MKKHTHCLYHVWYRVESRMCGSVVREAIQALDGAIQRLEIVHAVGSAVDDAGHGVEVARHCGAVCCAVLCGAVLVLVLASLNRSPQV